MFLSQYHFYCFPPAIFPPCSNLFLTSGQHESVLHLYMLVILEMFNKWNYVVCKLWELVFFTQGDFLEVHPGCGMCQELLFLLLHHVSMLWMHRSLLNHSHSERHLSSFHFWLLPKKKKKLLWTFMCRFLYEHKFSFFWDEAQQCDCFITLRV